MQKKELLYEGKAKKVYTTEDPEVYIVSYKDDATAFNGLKKGTIAGKGVVNNEMSNFMFRMLEEKGVPTHYVEELNERETAVKKVTIIPLEVIVRNVAAGSLSKRLGLPEAPLSNAPCWSSAIRTTSWEIPWSTITTFWPWIWPLGRSWTRSLR